MLAEVRLWLHSPDNVRRVAYGAAAALIVLVLTTVQGGTQLDGVWLVIVIPVGLVAIGLRPRYRAVVFAVCAGFVLIASTGESVQLGLAAAALVFLSSCEDPAGRPWLGWALGLVGAIWALIVALLDKRGLYGQPILFVAAGYFAFVLFRSWSQRRTLRREASELRGQAAWLEQRTNLARELHDVVGHHVTAMVVQAEAGQLSDDPAAAMRTIADTGRTALGELDTLVTHLRDPDATVTVSAPPRLSDIDELLAAPLRQFGLAVLVQLDPAPGLDELGTLTVYRITQEALTNIARHAGATAAWVELVRIGDRVRLRVSDDGSGPPRLPTRGSGLLGIQERVRACAGTWELSNRPGGGTILEVSLPAGPS